jgi:hypothetical protein
MGFAAAVPQHLAVERHAPVGVVRVKRLDDLFLVLDPYQLAGLQVGRLGGGLLEVAFDEGIPPPVPDPQWPGEGTPAGILVRVEQSHADGADGGERAGVARTSRS